MKQGKILHIVGWDKKFVLPFMSLIHKHFDDGRHQFIVYGLVEQSDIPTTVDAVVYRRLQKHIYGLSKAMHQAEKIIIHGLSSSHLRYILSLQPWLLQKCYWVIWGGDLYAHMAADKNSKWKKNEFFRHRVIKRLGHLITYVEGDVALARQWYGATGQYHECLMYPSNIYQNHPVPARTDTDRCINLLLGNSAYPSNNHQEILERLLPFRDQNIAIYTPLSYGKEDYAAKVIETGHKLFGEKFKPLTEFMPFEQYLALLSRIDIAIFNHNRQQGMGNLINLLGLGKKVYLRSDVTPWKLFERLGIQIYDTARLDLSPIAPAIRDRNQTLIRQHFSEERLVAQLKAIFES